MWRDMQFYSGGPPSFQRRKQYQKQEGRLEKGKRQQDQAASRYSEVSFHKRGLCDRGLLDAFLTLVWPINVRRLSEDQAR